MVSFASHAPPTPAPMVPRLLPPLLHPTTSLAQAVGARGLRAYKAHLRGSPIMVVVPLYPTAAHAAAPHHRAPCRSEMAPWASATPEAATCCSSEPSWSPIPGRVWPRRPGPPRAMRCLASPRRMNDDPQRLPCASTGVWSSAPGAPRRGEIAHQPRALPPPPPMPTLATSACQRCCSSWASSSPAASRPPARQRARSRRLSTWLAWRRTTFGSSERPAWDVGEAPAQGAFPLP